MPKYSEMKFLAKEVLIKFVADHPFQWFASLTFKVPVIKELARERLREWTRKICRGEEIQVAYIAVVKEEETRCHWHLLMIGQNRWGKTLHKVSIERWAREWWKVNCGETISWNDGARIEPVYEITGVSRYLIDHLIPNPPSLSALLFYNKRLLMKCRSKCDLETPPAVTRNHNERVTYLLRRNGEEYRRVKDQMVAVINKLEGNKGMQP